MLYCYTHCYDITDNPIWHSASLDSVSWYSNESDFSSVYHRLPPRYDSPRSRLPRSLQLALVLVDAPREQVACGGPGDSDHPCAHRHVRVSRGGASGTGGALDRPRSWRVGSVGVDYLHLEGDRCITSSSFSSTSRHESHQWASFAVTVDDMCATSSSKSRLSSHQESCRRDTGFLFTWSYTNFFPLPYTPVLASQPVIQCSCTVQSDISLDTTPVA